MIALHFEKLYQSDRIQEPCTAAIPFGKGVLWDCDKLVIERAGIPVPKQCKVTGRWEDGSIKWAFIRFLADLPGNSDTQYFCRLDGQATEENHSMTSCQGEAITVETGAVGLRLTTGKMLFDQVVFGDRVYSKDCFEGPALVDRNGNTYDLQIENWQVAEDGPICAVIKGKGSHLGMDGKRLACEITLTAYRHKPWVEFAYRLINTSYDSLPIESLDFIFHAPKTDTKVKTCVASSNYATNYRIGENGETVEKTANAQDLQFAGNEHMSEVFYGTFFADYRDEKGGLCVTVFQAQQNYPKAIKAHNKGLVIGIVPKGLNPITMHSGVAREQKMLLHFHDGMEPLAELNNRSTIYQMPDRPILAPQVYRDAQVFEDVFLEQKINDVEMKLTNIADSHARCFGMLNWGDSPDPGYSQQGRGGGTSVWTNNEYDFSHACTLMYIRTGKRRFLDYMLVSSRHWMDVDVCHFSDDPYTFGGQWEHAKEHIVGSHMACSHEWVAGLLDYYHFTGEEVALETAIGIGQNVLRLLEKPEFQRTGELNARETGWALRTLIDLYLETNDEAWLEKCDWIVSHFEEWELKYGHWLAPYTDNTQVRVVFMIAVAVASLMRWYRVCPQEKIRGMIIRAVDDLMENCRMDNGLFYYKELPSLQRASNPNILEALTDAYELTSDVKYLEAGIETFKMFLKTPDPVQDFSKRIEGDALIHAGIGTKSFAQTFWPVMVYYKAAVQEGILPKALYPYMG